MLMLPPGPQMGRLAQTTLLARDPLGVLRRARARYGPVFTLRLTNGGPVVVVGVAEDLARVTELDPGSAHAGVARRRVLPFASPRSVFGGDDEAHRAARLRVHDALTPAAVARIEPAIAPIAERHAASWPAGRPFKLRVRLRDVADEVWVRLVLRPRDEARVDALVRAARRALRTPGNPPVPPPGEGHGVLGTVATKGAELRLAPFADLVKAEVAERRAGGTGELPGDADGLLARFAATDLDPEAVVEELTVVTAAALEATASGLTSVTERLAHHPELAARFAGSGGEDPQFGPVVDEALRLRPVAMGSLRRLTRPITVGGHELPAGATLLAPSLLLHHDPAQFTDPDTFVPQRFEGGVYGPFFPWGGGARACVGRHLGQAELRQVVPAVLRTRRLRPVMREVERPVERATIIAPQRGALVVAT
jgi:cytochrome P450